jgi:sodium transport system permease protein
MTMFAMLTVFRKEMVDHLRDGRSILISMIYPLMGPLLLGVMFFTMRVNEGAPLVVPVVNPESAPDLVRFLESRGATMQPL